MNESEARAAVLQAWRWDVERFSNEPERADTEHKRLLDAYANQVRLAVMAGMPCYRLFNPSALPRQGEFLTAEKCEAYTEAPSCPSCQAREQMEKAAQGGVHA